MNPDPTKYLGDCDVIDGQHVTIARLAAELAGADPVGTAERCFGFVRDQIKHTSDYQLGPITCRASDVLAQGTGYCYAKSHLLCALLRANDIPAGLCYQRLSLNGVGPPYCLHGLNAVHLPDFGWYRMDARGNRADIETCFTPPVEHLAFSTDLAEEKTLPDIYVAPLRVVVVTLRKYDTWRELDQHLPDTVDV